MSSKYTIRDMQAILTFGPGAIHELPDRTVIMQGLDYWNHIENNNIRKKEIVDIRLARRLGVSRFYALPLKQEDENRNDNQERPYLPAMDFPRWMICNHCSKMFFLDDNYYQHKKRIENNVCSLNDTEGFKKMKTRFSYESNFCLQCGIGKDIADITELPDYIKEGKKSRKFFKTSSARSFRWVMVCEDGHLEDIPLLDWIHGNELCQSPELRYYVFSKGGLDLKDQYIECSCGKKRNLSQLLNNNNKDEQDFKCNGRSWQLKNNKYNCNKKIKIMQKGDSGVYYPRIMTSLVIPPWDQGELIGNEINKQKAGGDSSYSTQKNGYKDGLKKKIEEWKQSEDYTELKRIYNEKSNLGSNLGLGSYINEATKIIQKELNNQVLNDQANGDNPIREMVEMDFNFDVGLKAQLVELLEKESGDHQESEEKQRDQSESQAPSPDRDDEAGYRSQEFHFFKKHGEGTYQTAKTALRMENLSKSDLLKSWLDRLAIVDKITITTAQFGFFRVSSPDYGSGSAGVMQPIKASNKDWLAAVQIPGEGIFLGFKADEINKWYEQNADFFKSRFDNSDFKTPSLRNVKIQNGKELAGLYLVHSFSHFLINALSFEAGFNAASIRERIYLSEGMYGVFLHTSSGDSDASLGGLAYRGHIHKIEKIMRTRMPLMSVCSNDPVCAEGREEDSVGHNYAACFSCLFLSETSCEMFNHFLDRMCLMGDGDGKNSVKGFFVDRL